MAPETPLRAPDTVFFCRESAQGIEICIVPVLVCEPDLVFSEKFSAAQKGSVMDSGNEPGSLVQFVVEQCNDCTCEPEMQAAVEFVDYQDSVL